MAGSKEQTKFAMTAPTMQSLKLSTHPQEICDSLVGNSFAISGRIQGVDSEKYGAVLLIVDLAGEFKRESLSQNNLGYSEEFGPFVYIQKGQGSGNRFSVNFFVPDGAIVRKLSIRLWNSNGPIFLDEIAIERQSINPHEEDVLVNISIDVEALPHRAAEAHVDRLVFGRFYDEEYGIGRQVKLFKELGVPATFYLELGECQLWGKEPLYRAGKLLLDSGFDLQLHLHSEVYIRALRKQWGKREPPILSNLDGPLTRQCMEYACERYFEITGTNALAFRAGAFKYNKHTVQEGSKLGIKAFSNYRADQRPNNAYDFAEAAPMRPFVWETGAFEFPITISPEPLSAMTPEECWRRILHHVRINRTWVVNIVIHSWSLMARDSFGHHYFSGPELEQILRKIIALAPKGVRFVSMKEIVAKAAERPHLFDIRKNSEDLMKREPH